MQSESSEQDTNHWGTWELCPCCRFRRLQGNNMYMSNNYEEAILLYCFLRLKENSVILYILLLSLEQ